MIDMPGGFPSLGNGPYDQRLAPAAVTGGEYALLAGHVGHEPDPARVPLEGRVMESPVSKRREVRRQPVC